MYFTSKLKPIDVKIFIEDGVPYLDYIGIAETDIGKAKVHIKKISLDITAISRNYDESYACDWHGVKFFPIRTKLEILAENENWFDYEILEVEMTKKQAEQNMKENLGYKVNIVDK